MKKLIIKIVLLSFIVFITQAVYIHFVPIPDIKEIKELRLAIKTQKDVFYFGDSTDFTFGSDDKQLKTTDQLLQEYLPTNHIQAITRSGNHAEMYQEYARFIRQSGYIPKVIIVTINMRLFSVESENNPAGQFTEDRLYLQYKHSLLYPFLPFLINAQILSIYPITFETYYNAPVFMGGRKIGIIKDFIGEKKYATYSNQNLKDKIILFYMARLQENDRRLQSLVDILNIYKRTPTKIIYYVTPIDYQTGDMFLGPIFRKQVSENVDTIIQTLNKHGAKQVINMAFDLPSKDFIWKKSEYINEHINDVGRAYIAKKIATEIKK